MKRSLCFIVLGLSLAACNNTNSTTSATSTATTKPVSDTALVQGTTGNTVAPTPTSPASPADAMQQQATIVANAMINMDYETMVNYLPETYYKLNGGRDSMLFKMRRSFEEAQKQGIKFTSARIEPYSEVVDTAGELQAIMKEIMDVKTPAGMVYMETPIIAMSADGGKKWTFTDAGDRPKAVIKKAYPNLSSTLSIFKKVKRTR